MIGFLKWAVIGLAVVVVAHVLLSLAGVPVPSYVCGPMDDSNFIACRVEF